MTAERHRRIADGFTAVVSRVDDWAAPAPVAGWTAADVVDHLVTWSRGFLAAGGVQLDCESVVDDPAASWRAHSAAVQRLLDSPRGAEPFRHPHVGTSPLAEMLDRVYTTDVLMHTWDLAEAAGTPSGLDAAECAEILAGMREIEHMLRDSGQFGPPVPVPANADAVVQLMAFAGRDPDWRSSANRTPLNS